ncbi:hypothetical protein [Turicibacter bilis]|uniref:Uncharacterized protein n=1 Tax=Turicibacter bilis TaxID=2735723 RepID=A0ABY5JK82_9FIRM|nr:hypothetical protein [Turicibacter bilis]MBS3200358.1 hypothetical protein [Turicibacter bilis]UUF07078.1 hypothetical protein J0J69_06185 [Turicibacter bilis]
MRRYLLLFCCLLLAGCGNKIANQMIKEAKDAFEDKSYERAVGLLKLASDESSNKSYEIWYEQGEAFLNMLEYDDLTLFDDLLLAWTDLNLIDSEPSFVKEEAVAYIKGKLSEVKELASGTLESREMKEIIELIRLIEKRMGTLKMFESEIEELISLKQEMEE